MVDSKDDFIMTSLMNYPDFKFSFFDFLLIKTTRTTTITSTATIIINIIAVVTGSPIFKPVLGLSNRDPKPDPDPV